MEIPAPSMYDAASVASQRLALVGHPNVGKSAIFNRLTGSYVTVSNYPGTTVDVVKGVGTVGGASWQVIDTPGVRTLSPQSEDELVTLDLLLRERPEVVVQVADAKNLRTSLVLTSALADLGLPMILVLNMSDEAESRGIRIDAERLSELLDIPVVPTVATAGVGLDSLRRAVGEARLARGPAYPAAVEEAVDAVAGRFAGHFSARLPALTLLSAPAVVPGSLQADAQREGMEELIDRTRAGFRLAPELLIHAERESWAGELVGETVLFQPAEKSGWLEFLDRWSMRGLPGYGMVAAVVAVMYYFVGVLAAGHGVDFLENTVFESYVNPWAIRAVERLVHAAFLRDLLVGPFGVVTMALSYALAIVFPIVTAFFILFGILEDSGYLPRLSVMLDRLFRLVGLNGKAVIPMVLGLGCGTMATLSTRIMDSRKERLLATFLLTLGVPCSAQLGVIMGMLGGRGALPVIVWLGAVLGTLLVAGWAAARVVPGGRVPFVVDIPPLRIPNARNIAAKVKMRLMWYLKEAVPLFVLGTMVLFFLDRLGLLAVLERAMAPVVSGMLGLPRETAWCFLLGFMRRDYGAAGLFDFARQGLLDPRQIVVSLVAVTLFVPCVAQFFVMIRERGWRIACVIVALVMALAVAVASALNAVLLGSGLL